MDKLTLKRIETAHPLLRDELKCILADISVVIVTNYAQFRFSHVLRTFKEQDDLYAIGRTKPGRKVTNASGGNSNHNYGLAVDIVQLLDKDRNGSFESASWNLKHDADFDGIPDWDEVVDIFKRYGWSWGGLWRTPDSPHFEKTFGFTIQELKKLPTDREGYPIFNNSENVKKCDCNCT